MIPRTLVPWNARPADFPAAEARRTVTALDDRTLIPSYFAAGPLEERTSIPASLPLESVAPRRLVPRDLPFVPLETHAGGRAPEYRRADPRIAIPADAAPFVITPRGPTRAELLPEVVDPDVFTTGDVELLASPEEPRTPRTLGEYSLARVSSFVFHLLLIAFIVFGPRLFPERTHLSDQFDISRQNLGTIFLPRNLNAGPRVEPSPPLRSSAIHVDPRILRKIAPPEMEPQPLPGKPEPERVIKELPEAPKPQVPLPESAPQPNAPRPTPRLESPDEQPRARGLILPKISPGGVLEDSLRAAERNGAGRSAVGTMPMPGGSYGAPGGGGAGGGLLTYGYQMLTPTEGVDFSNYLARVLASVKQNWYAIIPESARLGDKGRVILRFRIMREGAVPEGEPVLEGTSGKQPLDSAAISAIRASNPFQPLPPAFSGPYIELRFIFLYNIPLSALQQ